MLWLVAFANSGGINTPPWLILRYQQFNYHLLKFLNIYEIPYEYNGTNFKYFILYVFSKKRSIQLRVFFFLVATLLF